MSGFPTEMQVGQVNYGWHVASPGPLVGESEPARKSTGNGTVLRNCSMGEEELHGCEGNRTSAWSEPDGFGQCGVKGLS